MSAHRRRLLLAMAGIATAILVAAIAVAAFVGIPWIRSEPPDVGAEVRAVCAACHAYPPPDSFPRAAWKREVVQGYEFARELRPDLVLPPMNDITHYY